jgi:RecA/RadA recombinase
MSSAAEIMKALTGEIGKNDDDATVTQYLDTGYPMLNYGSTSTWDKGFPVGRLVEVAGPPSAGKTAIATRVMAAAQTLGGVAGFMDHERSFSIKLAPRLGLDITPGRFIYKKPETFEESVAIFHLAVKTIREKKLIAKTAPMCWVFDSLSAMTPQSVLYDSKGKLRDADTRNMNDNTALSRATSAHFPSVAQIAEKYGVCVIFLNQMRKDITVKFGDPRKTSGGDSPAFYFSQRIWLSSAKIKINGEVVGMEVTGNFVKNKVARPFLDAKYRFMFQKDGTGRFDFERSLVEFLNDEKLLTTVDDTVTPPKNVKAGYVLWEGKQLTREALARLIEAEGPKGFAKLTALLPEAYEPAVVATVDLEEDEAAA